MSRPNKEGRDLQLESPQELVDRSGIRIGTGAPKLNRKPAEIAGTRQLFRDYEELHGLKSPDKQKLAHEKTNMLQSQSGHSSYGPSVNEYNPDLYNHGLVTKDELVNGYKGNYDELYRQAANNQTTLGRSANALARFLPSTFYKFVGSLGHAGGAIIDGVTGGLGYVTGTGEGTQTLTYDNYVSKWAKSAEEYIDSGTRIYEREGYRDANTLLGKAAYAEFWTQDVADGVEFVASNLIGGYALKAAKFAATGGKVAGAAKSINNAWAELLGMSTAMTLGEAGMEGAETYAHVKEKLRGKKNPDTGAVYTKEEIEKQARIGADAVWQGNMTVLMPSNMLMTKTLLMPNRAFKASQAATKKAVRNALLGQGGASAVRQGLSSGAKNFAMGVASEGLWEENIQLSITKASERLAIHGDTDWYSNTASKAMENIGSFVQGLSGGVLNEDQMEGAMSIFIGGIIGGGMGIKQGISDYKKAVKKEADIKDIVSSIRGEAGAAQGLFTDDFQSIYQGSLDSEGKFVPELDENGKFKINWDSAQQLFYRRLYDEKLAGEMGKALAKSDEFHVNNTRDLALARMVHGLSLLEDKLGGKIKSGQDGVAMTLFNEQIDSLVESFEDKEGIDKAELAREAKELLNMWREVQNGTKITDVVDGLTTAQFENVFQKVAFYNKVKLKSYNKALDKAKASNNTEAVDQLETLIADTEQYLENITKNKKQAAKRWAEELTEPAAKRARIQEIDNKLKGTTLNAKERAKLEEEKELALFEFKEGRTIHGKSNGSKAFPRTDDQYNSTELSIAEHESYETKAELGIKHSHFFKLGQSALGAKATRDIMDNISEMTQQAMDPNLEPHEKAKILEDIEQRRRDLVSTIRGNANYATPEMLIALETLKTEAETNLNNLAENVKNKSQVLNDITKALNKVIDDLNKLVGNKPKSLIDVTRVLNQIGSMMPIQGLPDTADQTRSHLESLSETDRNTFIDHIGDQVQGLVDAGLKDILTSILESEAPEAVADYPGLTSVEVIKAALGNFESSPEVVDLLKQKTALEAEEETAKKDLEQAETAHRKEETFYNNNLVPAIDAVENGKNDSKELSANKDNYNYWRRKVANLTIDKIGRLFNNANANRSAFSDINSVMTLRSALDTLEKIYKTRKDDEGKGLMINTAEFKGLEKAIEDAKLALEDMAQLAQENKGKRGAKQQAVLDSEAVRDLNELGLGIDDNGEVIPVNGEIWDLVENVVGPDKISKVFDSAEDLAEQGIAARIILELYKERAGTSLGSMRSLIKKQLKTLDLEVSQLAADGKLFLDFGTLGLNYFNNPDRLFDKAMLVKFKAQSAALYKDNPQNDPFFIYSETKDINELTTNIENSELSQEYKDAYVELLAIHTQVRSLVSLRDKINSDYKYARQFISEDDILDAISKRQDKMSEKHVPTIEQLVAIRQLVNNFLNVENVDLGTNRGQVMSYLRGIPGTGKTKMVLKWATDILGLESSKMYSFSHNSKSSKGIADSTGTSAGSLENFLASDLTDIELLVIDEIGFFDIKSSEQIQTKINETNEERKKNGQKLLAVIGLGDPSQITQSVRPLVEEGVFMQGMRVINPLTQSYRSNVPSISNLFSIFQRNPKAIEGISVTANVAIGTPWDPNNMAVGVHSGSAPQHLLSQVEMMKTSGRTKVIIVNDENAKGKYNQDPTVQDLVSKGDLEILTYVEVQGQTFGEVYIDLDVQGQDVRGKAFDGHPTRMEYNQAMYTAISRAKDYVFVVDPTFTNNIDDNLNDNKAEADQEIEDAFTNYTERHDTEKRMLSEHLFTQEERDELAVTKKKPEDPEDNSKGTGVVVEDLTDETSEPIESVNVVENDDLNEDLNDPEDIDEQSTKNNKPVGKTTDMKDNPEIVNDDGNEILDISNPEYVTLKAPEVDGVVPEDAPVILVKVNYKGKIQTMYLGQVKRNGEWTDLWREMGIASTKDRATQVYKKKVGPREEAFNKGNFKEALYDGAKLKSVHKAITYDADGRAVVDLAKGTNIMGVSTLASSSTLAYRYGDNMVNKGAINKLFSLFKNVFGDVADVVKGAQIKIYSGASMKEFEKLGTAHGRFIPKHKGVPDLVITVNGRKQYTRLTPRRINFSDLTSENGKFRSVYDVMQALKQLKASTRGGKYENINLGHPAFNNLMKKLRADFERDSENKPVYKQSNYTLEQLKKDIKEGYAELQDLEGLDQETFDKFVEAAKTLVPAFYNYRIAVTKFNQSEVEKHVGSNPSARFMSEKEAGISNKEDSFVLIEDETAKKDARFSRDYVLSPGKGPAQTALNTLARSHTKDDIFPYRVKRKIAGKLVATAKSLLADKSNNDAAKYLETLKRTAIMYMGMTDQFSKDDIESFRKTATKTFEATDRILAAGQMLGIPVEDLQEFIKGLKTDIQTNPITLEGLEQLLGRDQFDPTTGEHAGTEAYLAMPLDLQEVNKLGENLTPENIAKLEGLMGTKIDTIQPTSVQLNFGKPGAKGKKQKMSEDVIEDLAQDFVNNNLNVDRNQFTAEDLKKFDDAVANALIQAQFKAQAKLEIEKAQKEAARAKREEQKLLELEDQKDRTLQEFDNRGLSISDYPILQGFIRAGELAEFIRQAEVVLANFDQIAVAQAEAEAKALKDEAEQAGAKIKTEKKGIIHAGVADREGKFNNKAVNLDSKSEDAVVEIYNDNGTTAEFGITRDRTKLARMLALAQEMLIPLSDLPRVKDVDELLNNYDMVPGTVKREGKGWKVEKKVKFIKKGSKGKAKEKIQHTETFGDYGKFRVINKQGELQHQKWDKDWDEWVDSTEDAYNTAKNNHETDILNNRNLDADEVAGPAISLKSAQRAAKRFLPGLRVEGAETWLQKLKYSLLGSSKGNDVIVRFVTKEVLDSMARPGENLFGLYKDGVVYALKSKNKEGEWVVHEESLKHEVFHKIFNEYLTPTERRKLRLAAARFLNNEDIKTMAPIEFEEILAREFQKYITTKKPSIYKGRLGNFFYNISKWFGFVQEHENELVQLFDAVQSGRMGRSFQLYPDYVGRRTLREIGKLFGNVNNMKGMIEEVRYLYNNVLTNPTTAYAMEDVYGVVIKQIRDTADRLDGVKGYEEKIAKLKQEASTNKQLFKESKDPEEKAKYKKKSQEAGMEADDMQNELTMHTQKAAIYSKLAEQYGENGKLEAFETIAEWLFPSWNMSTNSESVKYGEVDIDTTAEDTDAIVDDIISNFNMNDQIVDRKTVNQETKLSAAVKLFLGSVKYPKLKNGKIGDAYMTGRAAFIKMLDLVESLTFSGESDFLEQFKEAALESAGAETVQDVNFQSGIVKGLWTKVSELYRVATSEAYFDEDLDTQVDLPQDGFFYDSNTFVYTRGISNIKGEALKKANISKLKEAARNGEVVILNKADAFKALRQTNPKALLTTNDFAKYAARRSGIDNTLVVMLFKQSEARNTLAELASHMTSLREMNVKIAEVTNDYGAKSIRYIYTGQGLGMKSSLRSTVDDAVEVFVQKLVDEDPKRYKDTPVFEEREVNGEKVEVQIGLNTGVKKAYKDFLKNKWPALEAKLKSGTHEEYTDGIKSILDLLGLHELAKQPIPRNGKAQGVATNLVYLFGTHMAGLGREGKGVGDSSQNFARENVEDGLMETGTYSVVTARDIMENEGSVINQLIELVQFNEEWIRATSMRNAKGDTIFIKTQSTQGDDILNTLARVFPSKKYKGSKGNRKLLQLPAHLRTSFFQNNIFTRGINVINNIVDHDGFRDTKTGRATTYTREGQKDWFSRNFNAAFLSTVGSSVLGNLTYDQSLYTTSNRPNIRHVNMKVLNKKGIKESLGAFVDQVASRPYSILNKIDGKINEDGVKNFKAESTTNFEVFKDAMNIIYGEERARQLLGDVNFLKNIQEGKSKLVETMYTVLDNNVDDVTKMLMDMDFEVNADINKAVYKLQKAMPEMFEGEEFTFPENQNKKVKSLDKDKNFNLDEVKLKNLVRIWYMNNYINSYFVNQLVAGDSNFYKNALDQVKRLSGAFAPGLKGLVNEKIGMKKKFKAVILKDVKGNSKHLRDFLSRLLGGYESYTGLKEKVTELAQKETAGEKLTPEEQNAVDYFDQVEELMVKYGEGGFEYADAQGFVTPARADDITKGFGRAYGAGRVFKGAHFENVVRTDTEGNEISYPFMLKYSSVVLSDDLVDKYEPLRKLREAMERGEIDEAVFASGNKVGVPNVLGSGEAVEKGEVNSFNPKSVVELSNENFRLQSNPDHIAGEHGKGVANPTQLGYFLNVMNNLISDDFDGSSIVYDHVSKLIEEGAEDFFREYKRGGTFNKANLKAQVKKLLKGKGNERLLELVEGGVDFNAPHIVTKIFTQIAAGLADESVKIRFPGEKLTLQSAFGIETSTGRPIKGVDPEKARTLEFYTDEQGHLVAEVIVPSGSIPASIMEKVKRGEEVYLYSDAMGFRIPSTELHSAVALKIVDTYDERGSSMIIAPRELVPIHGSDFDVDSLFMITRNHTHLNKNQRAILDSIRVSESDPNAIFTHESFEEDAPVGHRKGKHVQWVVDKEFPGKMDHAIGTLIKRLADTDISTDNKKVYSKQLKLLKKLRKQFYQNVILDTFLKAITHPDNRARMLSPITMEMFNGQSTETDSTGLYKEGSIFRMLQDINIAKARKKYGENITELQLEEAKQLQKKVDLSDIRGNYEVYKSNMEGASLTGVFANSIKAMAYMLKAGGLNQGTYTQAIESSEEAIKDLGDVRVKIAQRIQKLKEQISVAQEKKEAGKTSKDVSNFSQLNASLKQLEEELEEVRNKIKQRESQLKGFVEAAKEVEVSNRPTLRINEETGNVDNAIKLNGKTYDQMQEYLDDENLGITNQPIWEIMDALVNAAIDNVKEQILPIVNANGLTANAISAMLTLGVPMSTITLLTNQPVIRDLDSSRPAKTVVNEAKLKMIEEYFGADYSNPETGEKYSHAELIEIMDREFDYEEINDDILTESLINENTHVLTRYAILKQFENAMIVGEDLATLSSALDVVRKAPAFKDELDAQKDKWDKIVKVDEDGSTEFNNKFSWNINDLFKVNPHIKVAFKYLIQELDNMIKNSFIKYAPEFEKVLYARHNRSGVNLHINKGKSRVKYVDEFMRYLITSIPTLNRPEILEAEFDYFNVNNTAKKKTGHEAWSQGVLDVMDRLKKHPKLANNRFVQSLDIRTNTWTKLKYVRFTSGSNLEYHDNIELQDAFLELAKFSVGENGALEYNPDNTGSLENFNGIQKKFAEYAIINFGLQFSSVNYSMALPANLISPYIDEFTKAATDMKDNPSAEVEPTSENDYSRQFEDFIDHFELEMAMNYASTLPFLTQEPHKEEKTLLGVGGIGTTVSRTQSLDVETGLYYDLKYFVKDGQRKESLPKFINRSKFSTGQPVVYIQMKSDSPNYVMYRRVGYGRSRSSYLLPTEVVQGGYDIDKAFEGRMASVSVEDLNADIIKIPDYLDSSHLEGTIVQLFLIDDFARLRPKYVKITGIRERSVLQEQDGFVWKDLYVDVVDVPTAELKETFPDAPGLEIAKRKKGSFTPLRSSYDTKYEITEEVGNWISSFKAGDKVSGKEAIEMLAGEDSAYGLIASIFNDQFGGIMDKFTIEFEENLSLSSIGTVLGYFSFNEQGEPIIKIDPSQPIGSQRETILHELSHGLTVAALRMPNSQLTKEQRVARTRLRHIYNTFKRQVKKNNPQAYRKFEYRLSNIAEFVAGVYTDPHFQALLQEYETTDLQDNKPTFLQKAWNSIANLLGISNDSNSLLIDTFATITDLIGDGSNMFDYTERLRGQKWGNVASPATSTTVKIMEDSKKLEVGTNPTTGEQLDFYTFTGFANKLNRVSDQVTGWLSRVLPISKTEKGKHWIDVKADKLFQGKDVDHKLEVNGKMITKDEYILLLKDYEHKGLAKGNIIHKMMEIELHNKMSEKTVEELDKELGEIRSTSTIKGAYLAYEWLKGTLPGILSRIGINTLERDDQGNPVYKESERDLALTEVGIASTTLGFAGTIDSIFQHPDGSYTLVDWKTGRSIEKEMMEQLFKYGDTFNMIFDNPINKAKMQLMFYAFMMKVENPEAQFRDLVAVWAPNKDIAQSERGINRVEVNAFLDIIENYYRNEDFETYQKILDKSPNVFKLSHYNGTNAQVTQAYKNPKKSTDDNLKLMQTHIKWLIQEHLDRDKMTDADKIKLKKMFSEYIKIAHDAGYKVESWKDDISFGSEWLGSYNNIDHPAIKIWQVELDRATNVMHKEINVKLSKFRSLLTPVYRDYLVRHGSLRDTIAKLPVGALKKSLAYPDYDKLYKNMMKRDKVKGEEVWRLITEQDEEWNAKDRLTDNERTLLTYMNDQFGSYFDPKNGFLNETAVVKDGVELSNLQLFNKQKQSLDQFKHYRGFLPIVPPTLADIVANKKGFFDGMKHRIKHWYLQSLTRYYENAYEMWEDENQALPIKYLGSSSQRVNELHSFNLESVFEKYTRAMVQKKHGDNLHAMGRAIQTILEDTKGKPAARLNNWIDKQVELQTLHRSEKGLPIFRKPIRGLKVNGKETQIDAGKVLQVISSLTSSTVMWFKTRSGLTNGAGAMGNAYKRAVSQKLARMVSKEIDLESIDFQIRDLMAGNGRAIMDSFLKDNIQGNLKNNKTWHLMKELSFLPDMNVLHANANEMMTARANLFSQDTAYLFHSLPEEITAATTMIAVLKSMPLKEPFTMKNGKVAKNMWDTYSVEAITNDEGQVEHKLQYNGPVRGKVKGPDGQVIDLKELSTDETAKAKYIYMEMQGAYREEERTILSWYNLGQAAEKFKKYLPTQLKTALMSKSSLRTIGEYVPVLDKDGKPLLKDGQTLMEWQEGVMEGRWRVMIKTLSNWVGTKTKLKALKNDNYKWDNLSKRDKMNLVEGYVTILSMLGSTMALAAIGAAMGWDDDDPMMMSINIAFTQMNQQYNLVEMAKNTLSTQNQFAGINKSWQIIEALSDVGFAAFLQMPLIGEFFGDPEDGLTSKGELLVGQRNLVKSIPGISAWYVNMNDYAKMFNVSFDNPLLKPN